MPPTHSLTLPAAVDVQRERLPPRLASRVVGVQEPHRHPRPRPEPRLARRSPLIAGAFVLALAGLAGLFAKVTVIDSLLDGDALNAVIGLVCYVRPGRRPLPRGQAPRAPRKPPAPRGR
ncbi:hypothetical protein ACFRFL_36915 [Streptomyces sp. NPDC056708]|uniref:hypothetical protein n=1 Tax=unclassified Streptomyces TaxID=2593676 RepID=UPI003677258E